MKFVGKRKDERTLTIGSMIRTATASGGREKAGVISKRSYKRRWVLERIK